jgi:hypothetical protein
VVKRWQQRYFVVAGHYLKYADSEEAVIASPKATVDLNALRGCTITRGAFLKLTFEDNMALDLQAATPEEADCWHDVLANFAPKNSERKSDLMQSLEYCAPRKGTLVFERKGSFERKMQSTAAAPSAAPAATTHASAASPPASPAVLAQQLPSSWSTDHVAAWLAGIGEAYGDYSTAFVKNGINGEELLSEDFGLEELEEMEVTSKMHQKRILKEIKKLKS